MHFSSAVVCAFVAYGGLACAQGGDEDVSLGQRDIEARDLMFLKSRPPGSGFNRIQDLFGAIASMPGPQLSMAPLFGSPQPRPNSQLLRPQGRVSRPKKSQVSKSSPWRPTIPDALLQNPNGYTVTTTVNVKPNEPRPAPFGATALRLPSLAAFKLPIKQQRLILADPVGIRPANSFKIELARVKALKPMMLRVLAAKRKAAAMQNLKKQQQRKERSSKAALALKAKLKKLARPGNANQKSKASKSRKADGHETEAKSKQDDEKGESGEGKGSKDSSSKSKKGSSEKEEDHKSEPNSTSAETKESKKTKTSSTKGAKEHDHAVETREAEADAEPEADADAEAVDDPAIWS